MTNDKGIFIKNIYYMLTYAFQVLNQKNYEQIASEEFDNIQDLFAAILGKGISQQLKQGLYKEYHTENDELSAMRGKLDIQGTVKMRLQRKMRIACEYDELSANNIFNQILKTTVSIMLRDSSIKQKYRFGLKRVLLFLDEIDVIEPYHIHWDRLHYHKNNRNYEMLMNICYFVLDGMLLTTQKGHYHMAVFSDKHMHRLFE